MFVFSCLRTCRDVAVVILRGGDGYVVGTFLGACRDN